jgi:hypothetical protein
MLAALIGISDARHAFPGRLSCLRLRGGSSSHTLQKDVQQVTPTTLQTVEPEEKKPHLRRGESVLVLPDLKVMIPSLGPFRRHHPAAVLDKTW